MADSDLWAEIAKLNREVDLLERKLATLNPEEFGQLQVNLAVLENTIVNLKTHLDLRQKETDADIKRLETDKATKSEVKIPHMIIYGLCGSALAAVLWALFEKIGLQHSGLH